MSGERYPEARLVERSLYQSGQILGSTCLRVMASIGGGTPTFKAAQLLSGAGVFGEGWRGLITEGFGESLSQCHTATRDPDMAHVVALARSLDIAPDSVAECLGVGSVASVHRVDGDKALKVWRFNGASEAERELHWMEKLALMQPMRGILRRVGLTEIPDVIAQWTRAEYDAENEALNLGVLSQHANKMNSSVAVPHVHAAGPGHMLMDLLGGVSIAELTHTQGQSYRQQQEDLNVSRELRTASGDDLSGIVGDTLSYVFSLMINERKLYADPTIGNVGVLIGEDGRLRPRLTDAGLVHDLTPDDILQFQTVLFTLSVHDGSRNSWEGLFRGLNLFNEQALQADKLWQLMDRKGLLGDSFGEKKPSDKFRMFPSLIATILRGGGRFDLSFFMLARNIQLSMQTIDTFSGTLKSLGNTSVSSDELIQSALGGAAMSYFMQW